MPLKPQTCLFFEFQANFWKIQPILFIPNALIFGQVWEELK
jgi:hypothetical protein